MTVSAELSRRAMECQWLTMLKRQGGVECCSQWSGDDASACRDESVGVSLNAASSADVRSQSNVQRVRDAVLASEALTVELWLRPHTVSTAGQETSLLAFGEWPVGSVLNPGSCDGCDLAVWHGSATVTFKAASARCTSYLAASQHSALRCDARGVRGGRLHARKHSARDATFSAASWQTCCVLHVAPSRSEWVSRVSDCL